MARTDGQIQQAVAGGKPLPSYQSNRPTANSAMSDAVTTDLVSLSGGEGSIPSALYQNASMGRPDARTALFGPGGSENTTLKIQVQTLSGTAQLEDGSG